MKPVYGLHGDNGNYYIVLYWGYIGIMEKKNETTRGLGFRVYCALSAQLSAWSHLLSPEVCTCIPNSLSRSNVALSIL